MVLSKGTVGPLHVVEQACLMLVGLFTAFYPTDMGQNGRRAVDQVVLLEVRCVCEASSALAATIWPGAGVPALMPIKVGLPAKAHWTVRAAVPVHRFRFFRFLTNPIRLVNFEGRRVWSIGDSQRRKVRTKGNRGRFRARRPVEG